MFQKLTNHFGIKGDPGAPGAVGAPGKGGINGTDGANGEEGSPWTAGGFLPPGATLNGGWAFTGSDATPTMVSFALPIEIPVSTDFSGLAGEAASGSGSWAITGRSAVVGSPLPCP